MPFICDVPGCGKSFATRHRLNCHRNRAHQLYSQTPAAIRWRAMRGRYVPAEPLPSSVALRVEKFRCRECGIRYLKKSDRARHVKSFHREKEIANV